MDLLRPDLQAKVQCGQEQQKANKDNKAPPHSFTVEDAVLVTNLPAQDYWLPGIVTKVYGSQSYKIRLLDG